MAESQCWLLAGSSVRLSTAAPPDCLDFSNPDCLVAGLQQGMSYKQVFPAPQTKTAKRSHYISSTSPCPLGQCTHKSHPDTTWWKNRLYLPLEETQEFILEVHMGWEISLQHFWNNLSHWHRMILPRDVLFIYLFIFIVIQLELYAFSPHPSTPPQLNPPPSPTTSLPHLHPPHWFCPCVLYSSSCNPLFPLSPPCPPPRPGYC